MKGTSTPPWLNFKLCGKLHPGESGKLEVTFTPTSEDFTELEQTFEMNFNVEVFSFILFYDQIFIADLL